MLVFFPQTEPALKQSLYASVIIQYLCHKINKKNGRGLKILFLASVALFSRDTHEAGPTPSLPTNHLKTVFHRLVHVLDLYVFFFTCAGYFIMAPGQSMSLFMNQLEASSLLMCKLFLCLYNYYAAHK